MDIYTVVRALMKEHGLKNVLNAMADVLLEDAEQTVGGQKLAAAGRKVGAVADTPEVEALG